MLNAELDSCKARLQVLADEAELVGFSNPVDGAALQDIARQLSEATEELRAVTLAIPYRPFGTA